MKSVKLFVLILILLYSFRSLSGQVYRWNDLSNNIPCNIMTMLPNIKYFNNKLYITNGSIGKIYISTNHGNSFETKDIDTSQGGFYNIQIKDESKLWLLRNSDNGLFKSTNAGNNWIFDGSFGNSHTNISKICFINDQTGYFIGTNNSYGDIAVFYKTTNGGNNFVNISLPSSFLYGYDLAIPDSTNPNIIFAVFSASSSGSIWKSTNAGLNWTAMNGNVQVARFYFLLPGKAWACGEQGKIYYFDGNNWTQQNSGVVQRLDCISFCNDGLHGWAGGPGSTMIKTINGGQTWLPDSTVGINVWFYDIVAVSPTDAYAIGGPRQFFKYSPAVGIKNLSNIIPDSFSLSQNYPNPFNPTTNIKFNIPKRDNVTLKVYDLLGKEVATLVNEKLQAGTYEVKFDGSNLPSGIYFYKLESESFRETKRMILIK